MEWKEGGRGGGGVEDVNEDIATHRLIRAQTLVTCHLFVFATELNIAHPT